MKQTKTLLIISLLTIFILLAACNLKLEQPQAPSDTTVVLEEAEQETSSAEIPQAETPEETQVQEQQQDQDEQEVEEQQQTEPEKEYDFILQDWPHFYKTVDIMTFVDDESEVEDLQAFLNKNGVSNNFVSPYDQPQPKRDSIIIVQSCHALVDDFLLYDGGCDEFLEKDRALIKLNDWNIDKRVILITATNKEDLLKAVTVLTNPDQYKLQGDELTLIVTDSQILALPTNDFK